MLLVYWYMYTKKYIVTVIIANRFERVNRDRSVGIAARRAKMSGGGIPVGANFPYPYSLDLWSNQHSL